MKKKLVGLMIATMAFMMVACGSKESDAQTVEVDIQKVEDIENSSQEIEDNVDEEIYESMSMANPWVDSDYAGVLEATGFEMVPPAEAVNVAYSYMPSTGMAQLNFVMENAMWVYRMQPTEALEDISGVYCDWDYVADTKIAGMDAMEFSYASEPEGDFIDDMDCTRVLNWFDAQKKVTHALVVMGKGLNGMDTAVYAENLFINKEVSSSVNDTQVKNIF